MLRLNFARTILKHRLRGYATIPSSGSIVDRYKEKLERKAKEIGVSSVTELKETLKEDIEAKKKEMNKIDPLKDLELYEKEQADKLRKRRGLQKDSKVRSAIDSSLPKTPYKTLSSYVDVNKMRELPEKELGLIWKARFQKNERALTAVLGASQFAALYANAFKNPSFVLPLAKDDEGYEMHFVQWSFAGAQTTHCMLTSLAEYKLHKEYAKPHTTLSFHQELAGDTGFVLMNGQLESDVALSMQEAQLLVLNVQRFYGGLMDSPGTERKLALLRSFSTDGEKFDVNKLIEEAASFD